jgi:hypothetical protein
MCSFSFIKSFLIDLCRLKYICNKEGVKASAIALTALAEYTGIFFYEVLQIVQNKSVREFNITL